MLRHSVAGILLSFAPELIKLALLLKHAEYSNMLQSNLLTSRDPNRREQALNQLCHTLAQDKDPQSPDLVGLSSLLTAILHHDPSPKIRCAALNHPLCPLCSAASALFDSSPFVRNTAVLVLQERVVVTDTAQAHTPSLFALLALETDIDLLLSILSALQHIYTHVPTLPPVTLSLRALGHQGADIRTGEQIFESMPCFAVVRDITEHDSSRIRCTVCELLSAMLMRMLSGGNALCAEGEEIARLCFATLELLVQDAFVSVRLAVVDILVRLHQFDRAGILRTIARLSERSAKCLLRMIEFSVDNAAGEVSATVHHVLRVLTCYPLATFSAYSLVENFLRRRWYLARIAAVRQEKTADVVVRLIEEALVSVARQNRDFALVRNLCKSSSEKLLQKDTAS